MNRGRAERERETQNLKQAPGSELLAQSPTRGSNSRTARSSPEPKSAFSQLSHPGSLREFHHRVAPLAAIAELRARQLSSSEAQVPQPRKLRFPNPVVSHAEDLKEHRS